MPEVPMRGAPAGGRDCSFALDAALALPETDVEPAAEGGSPRARGLGCTCRCCAVTPPAPSSDTSLLPLF